MRANRTSCSYFFLLFIFLQVYGICAAQVEDPDPGKWAIDLGAKGLKGNDSLKKIASTLQRIDSAKAFRFLDELERKGASKGDRFLVRFNCLKANTIYYWLAYYQFYQNRKSGDRELVKKQVMHLYSSAIDLAYGLEDDYLIAYASLSYAIASNDFGETGIAVMYGKNGLDLYEKLGVPVEPSSYQFLAELLYKVREYNQCIKYAKRAVIAWHHSPKEYKQFTVSCINTVALGYHRQKMYDSAFIYYKQALQLAKEIKDTLWTGIVCGNMGQVFYAQGKYDTAYHLLLSDYQSSKAKGYYDNAGNSLQWAARTNLAMGNKVQALGQAREAFQLLKIWPDANYLRNVYYTTSQIFRGLGVYDSAFYYNNLWSAINDSLEKLVATSSLAISTAMLNDKISRYNIQNLNEQKRAQLLLRNVIILAIIVFSIIALLMVNRQLLKQKIKIEKAEMEVSFATGQLKIFTEHIVEKTSLVEKLEQQIKGKEATAEQQSIISELSHQTILTEEDWSQFKSLFETIYPGFFTKLKERFPEITIAEQRMAALTRLHLTTKQIASMLGISIDSVHKSRHRLRQRLQVGTKTNLDELVASL